MLVFFLFRLAALLIRVLNVLRWAEGARMGTCSIGRARSHDAQYVHISLAFADEISFVNILVTSRLY